MDYLKKNKSENKEEVKLNNEEKVTSNGFENKLYNMISNKTKTSNLTDQNNAAKTENENFKTVHEPSSSDQKSNQESILGQGEVGFSYKSEIDNVEKSNLIVKSDNISIESNNSYDKS